VSNTLFPIYYNIKLSVQLLQYSRVQIIQSLVSICGRSHGCNVHSLLTIFSVICVQNRQDFIKVKI